MIDASDPMAKEEEQYSVFVFFFGFVGVYKVEEKKKERLQIRLFFVIMEKRIMCGLKMIGEARMSRKREGGGCGEVN